MEISTKFFRSIVDSLTAHIVVIDNAGVIKYANPAWTKFGITNGYTVAIDWQGLNYIEACDKSSEMGDISGKEAVVGIRKVIEGELDAFYFEYPCHSDKEKRWFMMIVTPLDSQHSGDYVISHHNITDRKLVEEEKEKMSMTDELTGLYNRRGFFTLAEQQLRQSKRDKTGSYLVITDVDYLKKINDTLGHNSGDLILIGTANILKDSFRESDIVARIGGDEFVVLVNGTPDTTIDTITVRLRENIKSYNNTNSENGEISLSIGVIRCGPEEPCILEELISKADNLMYEQKNKRESEYK